MGAETCAGPLSDANLVRRSFTVRGMVQGVGFRPFVYRIAREHSLAGWVRNTDGAVEIEVEGAIATIDAFARRLRLELPPLARVEALHSRPVATRGEVNFTIHPSGSDAAERSQPVPPDVAVCPACLAEVLDAASRRHRYPFTNCTDCGPRFTVIEALPYDRVRTTLRSFPLCDACRAEYEDPADRRFHAEPIACPACGPQLEFRGEEQARGEAALGAAVAALRAGAIVAIRGVGGFQLACDARDALAVERLRERKHREAKPFAIMVPHLAAARGLCALSEAEAALLDGPRAPIVLLRRRQTDRPRLAPGVAPGLDTLGVMLPGSPLHHLLLREFDGPLVLTSGNRSAEPIAVGNEEALERLRGIADAFLLHDREIASRYDDSVTRVEGGSPVVLRRARGYAPEPVLLARPSPAPILAVGPQLKNTFCLLRDDQAFVSQHIGDLDEALTRAHFHQTLSLYQRLFRVDPRVVAHDLHPGYASTVFALSLEGVRHVGVQHHHAHVAGCLAEHGVHGPAIGVAFDGSGYGTDGAVWGGELLVVDGATFRRAAHLGYLPLPGGDAAAREPWRMALAALAHAFGPEAPGLADRLVAGVPASSRRQLLRMVERGVRSPPSSSVGRLFDAVAALAGVCLVNRYEGEAAMSLEARAEGSETGVYPLPLGAADPGGCARWEPGPLIRAVVEDLLRGTAAPAVAARFHNTLAAAVLDGCRRLRAEQGLDTVALSGGCFQNARLARRTRLALEQDDFRVLTHRRVPTNDGGVSFGQAVVAAATLSQEEE